ncbi:hypothetical protein M569_17055 [Genlisea aurea]|uniref:BUB1 N-terminal domain-containing protein n=1 Tax=Genlisea aurea TaxID=192259 RepID=S8DEE4_9LAMI|nr:hypothetical protein M569_17055 [Genlisea aurea]
MSALYNGTFSSIVADIKSFAGTDPLQPWLRGIRKMKETLPPQLLNDKLPRFLQRCAETFLTDQRYANDLRYLRVWLQLMDFVDDPKAILKKMELNQIGTKSSLFYEAYSLYYEKQKKFDAAYRIYHLGFQNFAEPADRLQKSFDQFLRRKGRRIKNKQKSVLRMIHSERKSTAAVGNTDFCNVDSATNRDPAELTEPIEPSVIDGGGNTESSRRGGCREETAVYRLFVGSTILNEPEVENVGHHGLVDPTVNMKEAMEDINGMFGKPIEFTRKSRRKRPDDDADRGFLILPDDDDDDDDDDEKKKKKKKKHDDGGFFILSCEKEEEEEEESDGDRRKDLFEATICTKEAMADINKLFAMPI